MSQPITSISLNDALGSLELLPDRQPGVDPAATAEAPNWATQVTPYPLGQ